MWLTTRHYCLNNYLSFNDDVTMFSTDAHVQLAYTHVLCLVKRAVRNSNDRHQYCFIWRHVRNVHFEVAKKGSLFGGLLQSSSVRLGSVSEQPQQLHGRRSADRLQESLGVQLQVRDRTRRSDSIDFDVVLAQCFTIHTCLWLSHSSARKHQTNC